MVFIRQIRLSWNAARGSKNTIFPSHRARKHLGCQLTIHIKPISNVVQKQDYQMWTYTSISTGNLVSTLLSNALWRLIRMVKTLLVREVKVAMKPGIDWRRGYVRIDHTMHSRSYIVRRLQLTSVICSCKRLWHARYCCKCISCLLQTRTNLRSWLCEDISKIQHRNTRLVTIKYNK